MGFDSAWVVGRYMTLICEMDICLIGKPSLDTAPKPKRAPKQKKVETVNSDSDSEFGVPKKTAPKGEDNLCVRIFFGTFPVQCSFLRLTEFRETGYLF